MGHVDGPDAQPQRIDSHIKKIESQFRGERNRSQYQENHTQHSSARFHCENRIEDALKTELQGEFSTPVTVAGGYIKDSITQNREQYIKELCRSAKWERVQTQLNIGLSSHFEEIDIPQEGERVALLEKLRNGSVYDNLQDPSTILEQDSNDNHTIAADYDCLTDKDESSNSKRRNSMLDLAVLRSARHPINEYAKGYDRKSIPETYPDDVVEFCLANGAQFWPPAAVDIAIELKYFKTSTTPNGDTGKKILKDIAHLSLLTNSDSAKIDAEAYMIVVSNMNLFRRGDQDPQDHTKTTQQYREKLRNLGKLCEANGVHFWYIHSPIPGDE